MLTASKLKAATNEVEAVLKSAERIVDSKKEITKSTMDMIAFTIRLTKPLLMADESEETIPETVKSDPNCQCICHPDNCDDKTPSNNNVENELAAGLNKEQLQLLSEAMEESPITKEFQQNDRECKCLIRRMQLEQELRKTPLEPISEEPKVASCVEKCGCNCHKEADEPKKCTGTCAAHCAENKPETKTPSTSISTTTEEQKPEAKSEMEGKDVQDLKRSSENDSASATPSETEREKDSKSAKKKQSKSESEKKDEPRLSIFDKLSKSLRFSK